MAPQRQSIPSVRVAPQRPPPYSREETLRLFDRMAEAELFDPKKLQIWDVLEIARRLGQAALPDADVEVALEVHVRVGEGVEEDVGPR